MTDTEKISLAQLLERIVLDWLARKKQPNYGEEEQQLHQSAAQAFGTVHGGDPNRAQEVSQRMKHKLRKRLANQRAH